MKNDDYSQFSSSLLKQRSGGPMLSFFRALPFVELKTWCRLVTDHPDLEDSSTNSCAFVNSY